MGYWWQRSESFEKWFGVAGRSWGDKGTLRNGFDANFVTKWFAEVLVAGRLLKGQELAGTR